MSNFFRLEIDEHFANVINKIDIKAKSLLAKPNLTQIQIDKINQKRDNFINEIRLIRDLNLDNFKTKQRRKESPELKFQDFIQKFCFMLDFAPSKNDLREVVHVKAINFNDFIDEAFGYLIVCDSFVSEREIELFRSLVRAQNDGILASYHNFFSFERVLI
jgi:hypothetical protein